MVILDFSRSGAGVPAAVIGASIGFGAAFAVPAVLFRGIEGGIGTVKVERAHGVNGFGNAVNQPVDEVEVVTGFVDGKAS
jgi:hypothetical protein